MNCSTCCVRPVEVGQDHHHRRTGGEGLDHGEQRPGGLLPGPTGVEVPQRALVADQVEQALGDAQDLGVVARPLQDLGHHLAEPHPDGGGVDLALDARGLAQRLGHGPPHVGLAVGHAAALQHDGVVGDAGVGGQLVGQAALADTGVADQQQELGPAVGDGGVDGRGQVGQLVPAPDQGAVVPAATVARRQGGTGGDPGVHGLAPALQLQRALVVVGDAVAGVVPGGGADEHVAGCGGHLQALGHVDDIAHGRVVEPPARRAPTSTSPVFTPTRSSSSAPKSLAPSQISSCIRRAARTARSASSSWATGAPNRATMASPMILSTLPAVALDRRDQPLEAAIHHVLHLFGVGALREGREADEVREEDGDHPALVRDQRSRHGRKWNRTGLRRGRWPGRPGTPWSKDTRAT